MTDPSVQPGGASTQTSLTLLGQVRAKNPEAWERLVQLYGPLIYRWCRRACLQEADAADVGQDVFQAVSHAIARFEPSAGKGSFRRWLKTITNNKIRDFARRKRPGSDGEGGSDAQAELWELPDVVEDDSDDPDAPSDQLLLFRRAVELVLSEFKEETQQAFLRIAVEEHSPADVARDLGMTLNAVYLAKSRVKRRIREEFEGLIEGGE